MKKLFQLFIIIAVASSINACKSDKSDAAIEKEVSKELKKKTPGDCATYIQNNKINNLNISVFLDLSDRITQPKTIQKDLEYLKSISAAFLNHIKTKKLILLQDKIQIYFNPEPTNDTINNIAKKLHVEFTKDSPKSKIALTEELYAYQPSLLYELAQADSKNPKDYPGSDIWRFFKDNVEDYTISDCHRNILIILTDGYMYHENSQMHQENLTSFLTPGSLTRLHLNNANWRATIKDKQLGFIKANEGLENLEVLVIGIQSLNPQNPYSIDIIRAYWSQWFTDMGIQKFKIQNADLASSVDKVIADFINP